MDAASAESRRPPPLIWDAHAGFLADPNADLEKLAIWRDAGVGFLSVSVGFDVIPWTRTLATLAAFRRWILARPDRYRLVATFADVDQARRDGRMAIAFDIEGAAALDGRLEMVELYYALGVRQMLLAYNLDNAAAGGCHDDDRGLSDFGRAVVDEMNRVGMVVDLSHCGRRTSLEAMERSTAPVVFSHSNPRSLVAHGRNIDDEQIRACAATGGVVGAVGLDRFLGPDAPTVGRLADHVERLLDTAGPDHVGLGLDYAFPVEPLDFDLEAVRRRWWPEREYPQPPKDYISPASLPDFAEEMRRRGRGEAVIDGVLGANFARVARTVWR